VGLAAFFFFVYGRRKAARVNSKTLRLGGTEMPTIQIRTEIPGPRSRALMARREAAVSRGPYNSAPIFMASAEGATLEDVDGNRYLDFAGGIGCLNVGHRAPRVMSALRAQLEKHLHLCFAVTPYESYVALAKIKRTGTRKRLPENHHREYRRGSCGERGQNRAGLYQAPRGDLLRGCISWSHVADHDTHSKTHPYKAGFAPFASDVYRIPFAYPYRAEKGATAETFAHHLVTRSNALWRRSRWPRLSPSLSWAKADLSFRRKITSHFCRKSAASMESFSLPTKCSPASRAPGSGLPANTLALNRTWSPWPNHSAGACP